LEGRGLRRHQPVKVRTQVVAGMNYFMKVDVGEEEMLHVKVYDKFGELQLTSAEGGKKLDDPL